MRCGVGEFGFGFEVLGCDLIWCLAVQHPLAPGIVGLVEAAQQLFQGTVRVDVDAQHLAADPAVEALDHAVGLRCAWLGVAVLRAQGDAGLGESWREATAIVGQHTIVGQHMGELEGECSRCLAQEVDGTPFGLVVLDRKMDGTRAAVDGDEQKPLAPFAVAGPQLGRSSPRFQPRSGWNGCGGRCLMSMWMKPRS